MTNLLYFLIFDCVIALTWWTCYARSACAPVVSEEGGKYWKLSKENTRGRQRKQSRAPPQSCALNKKLTRCMNSAIECKFIGIDCVLSTQNEPRTAHFRARWASMTGTTPMVRGTTGLCNSSLQSPILRYGCTTAKAFTGDITIAEFPSSKGTGTSVWPVSRVLLWWISTKCKERGLMDLRGKRVIELGCGTGLVGIGVASYAGAKEVVLTDHHDQVLELVQQNIELNRCEARCRVGWWRHHTHVSHEIKE